MKLNPEITGDVTADFCGIINLIEQSLTPLTKLTSVPKLEWEESWLLMDEKNVGNHPSGPFFQFQSSLLRTTICSDLNGTLPCFGSH